MIGRVMGPYRVLAKLGEGEVLATLIRGTAAAGADELANGLAVKPRGGS